MVLIGECGTGKTHLATGLCVAACRQKRRVRFTTAANLVNELVEAQQHHGVRRVLARWMRYDLIALDEVGYVPLAEIGAEFLFQVIAERAETGRADRDHQLAVLGMDAGVSESAAVQSAAGSHHRPRAHHRDRHGVVSLPAHGGRAAKEKSFVNGRTGRCATRLRGPGVRSVLNAVLETGPQDSAPSGATETPTPGRRGKQRP